MSVEERLRGALQRQAEAFEPPVEGALDSVRRRGRRARWLAGAGAVGAAAAATTAVLGVIAVSDGGLVRDEVPPAGRPATSPPDRPSAAPGAPLRGSITADVDQPRFLAGRWTLRLEGNGAIGVSPPATFGGEVSGPVFTSDASTFRTSLFGGDTCDGAGSGIYQWLRVGDEIQFRALSDLCPPRERFFADSTWTVSTGDAARD